MRSLEASPRGRSDTSGGDPLVRGDSDVGEDEAGSFEVLDYRTRDFLQSGVDDGILHSHVREVVDGVDQAVASNDVDEGNEDVAVVVDNLVVVDVVDGARGGVGSDLYEGCRQTVQVEVVGRSFLFSSFSNNKKGEKKKKQRRGFSCFSIGSVSSSSSSAPYPENTLCK